MPPGVVALVTSPQVEIIMSKSYSPFSHKALRVEESSSYPILDAFTAQSKTQAHGYIVTCHRVTTLKHPARFYEV